MEEAREVGVEGEADDGVLFLLGRVVVRAALDAILALARSARLLISILVGLLAREYSHLQAVGLDDTGWSPGGEQIRGGDKDAKEAGYRCEEAKNILDSCEAVIHDVIYATRCLLLSSVMLQFVRCLRGSVVVDGPWSPELGVANQDTFGVGSCFAQS